MRYSNPIPASPDEIQQMAMDIIFAKDRRARRAQHNYARLLHLSERKLQPIINKWLEWTAKQLRAGLSRIRGKTPGARAKSIADWNKIQAQGEEMLKPILFEILTEGGNSVMGQRIRKQERFDPIGVEAVAWTTKHSAELVVEITNETMNAIREYIKTGVKAGKSTQKIAMELRPLVGLTTRDITAVANYHEMLILERPEYTAATQRSMAETYARRLHRRRAATISRTETAYGLTEGQRQGYDQMGVKKLERVEDPECCDICAEHQGQIYSIAEAEGVLPEHPNSYSKDTEIYAIDGWKPIKKIEKGEIVLNLNLKTLNLEKDKIIGKISHFQDKMISFESQNFSMLVTPGHQMVCKQRNRISPEKEKWELIPAADVPFESRFYRSSEWKGLKPEKIKIGDMKIAPEIYSEFMGYWLSDGSLTKNGGIFIAKNRQKKKAKYEKIEKLLSNLPFKIYEWQNGLYFKSKEFYSYLQKFGYSFEKYIPEELLNLDALYIRKFLDAFLLCDGHQRRTKKFKNGYFQDELTYFTSSKKLADNIGECLLKTGKRPSYYLQKNKDKLIKHKNGYYKGNYDIWIIRECYTKNARLERKEFGLSKKYLYYGDIVYCIETEKNHTLLVRRNGKVAWSGNCEGTWVAA